MVINSAQRLQYFVDLASSLSAGKNQADQRVQVKMPKRVVQELDRLFSHVDRSHLLTQLATIAIAQELQFQDRSILRSMAASQQQGLDDMVTYLEDRDANITQG